MSTFFKKLGFGKDKELFRASRLAAMEMELWRDEKGNTLLHRAIIAEDEALFHALPKSLQFKENGLGLSPGLLAKLLKREKFLPFFESEEQAVFRLETHSAAHIFDRLGFEKEMGLKIFPTLHFEDEEVLSRVIKKCAGAIKKEEIEAEQLWYGHYFENEIAKGFFTPAIVRWTDPVKEFGLYNILPLKKGQYVGEYGGLVRKRRKAEDDKNPYCFEYLIAPDIETNFTIDARLSGNICRFINHSYQPNLMPVLAYWGKIMHIIFVAAKNIPKDSELTYDYGPKYWSRREKPLV